MPSTTLRGVADEELLVEDGCEMGYGCETPVGLVTPGGLSSAAPGSVAMSRALI